MGKDGGPADRSPERIKEKGVNMSRPKLRPLNIDPEKFVCLHKNPCYGCKYLDPYNPPHIKTDTYSLIVGWCKRFKPDPDSGYVYQRELPPCAVWTYEKGKERNG